MDEKSTVYLKTFLEKLLLNEAKVDIESILFEKRSVSRNILNLWRLLCQDIL